MTRRSGGKFWKRGKPAKAKNRRIYWVQRTRGGPLRFYVDLRDLGDKRRPLIATGTKRATDDLATAEELATRIENELRQQRLRRIHNLPEPTDLEGYVREHLLAKTQAGRVGERTLADNQAKLTRAIEFFGGARMLDSIGVTDVRDWLAKLEKEGLSGGTLRHHLNALSNLYRRAASESRVPVGYNPAAALMEKPQADRKEARWLEVHDAALLLESARTYRGEDADNAYPLVATFLLTGGRSAEVLGIEADDVRFDRERLTFREHEKRRLKTKGSFRVLPLWPQLAEILKPWLAAHEDRTGRLFPGYLGNEKRMNELLDAVAVRAGWKAGEIRSLMFRHTYAVARLHTLDNGQPVSPDAVAKELGHTSAAMVERVYGRHFAERRHRAEVVEYRVEQHAAKLGDRLANLRNQEAR